MAPRLAPGGLLAGLGPGLARPRRPDGGEDEGPERLRDLGLLSASGSVTSRARWAPRRGAPARPAFRAWASDAQRALCTSLGFGGAGLAPESRGH